VLWLFIELESALDESTRALAQAAEQREADHAAMSEAILDFCRVFGFGDVPSGSPLKVACRPWVTTCAVDSARRYTTASGGPSPCSLPLRRGSGAGQQGVLPP
jgi:hypothetical protein